MLVATTPAIAMLVVFWSLAIHMHQALGGWPTSIGEHGFPTALRIHADVAMRGFIALVWSAMLLVPVAALVCAAVRPSRRFFPYVGVYLTSCLFAAGVMQLAPARFLYWWWD